jgi:hypothetical protein
MHSSVRTIGSIATMLFVVLGLATALEGQQDFRGGDVFLGNTGGKVVVFRPSTNSVLETLSDGVTNPGPITSFYVDNTWHLLTSDPGTSSNQSKIVRFTILPTGSPTPKQTVLHTFDASVCNTLSSTNIQSIAIDRTGNILVANTTPPTLAVISSVTGDCSASASSVAVSSIGSIDLNTDESRAYFTSGDGNIRTVELPLTSPIATVSTFLSFNGPVNLFDIRVVPPGALTNCGSGTSDCLLVVAQGNTNFCTSTLTGISAKSCVLLIDTSTKAVVAKYTISGQNSLQSLTLDPIVHDCTAVDCAINPPVTKLDAFWVAPASNQFFRVKIASGSNDPYSATVSGGLSISSLFVYSGFGANQSIPTKFSGMLTTDHNFATFDFPLSDSNTLAISQIPPPGTDSPTSTSLTLFASTIDPAGGSNDANHPCAQTATNGTSCVVWALDTSPEETYILHVSPPNADNNTRGFRDETTDTTISLDSTFVGRNSLYTLHQIDGPDKGCHYVPTTQFTDGTTINPNRNSITFKFQCDGLPGTQLQTLAPPAPRISIVNVSGPNPVPFFPGISTLVGGTCCTATDYRYDTSANQWVINVSFKGVAAGTQFNATTFIDSQKAQAFDLNFTLGSSK